MPAAKRLEDASLVTRLRSPFRAAGQFLSDVWFEMKRVVWPSREEAQSFTAVVIIAVGIVAVWVGSLDWIAVSVVSALRLYSNQ
jgi:preprotein translocase SecE subunit